MNIKELKGKNGQKKKQNFPFGQLPIIIYDDKQYAQTHSIARLCAIESGSMQMINLKQLLLIKF